MNLLNGAVAVPLTLWGLSLKKRTLKSDLGICSGSKIHLNLNRLSGNIVFTCVPFGPGCDMIDIELVLP